MADFAVVATSGYSRVDLVYLTAAGGVSVLQGVASVSPVDPVLPATSDREGWPIAYVTISYGDTSIKESAIRHIKTAQGALVKSGYQTVNGVVKFTGAPQVPAGASGLDAVNYAQFAAGLATKANLDLGNISTVAAAADSNVKIGPDVVIEHKIAADGRSWYRKYKSGWIEQGGLISSGEYFSSNESVPVTLAVNFTTLLYNINITPYNTDNESVDSRDIIVGFTNKSLSGFTIVASEVRYGMQYIGYAWRACGI